MSNLREAENERILALVMDALAESLRYVADTMAEDAAPPREGARCWIAMDITGPLRATVALECPGEQPADRAAAHAGGAYAEMLNVAVSHTVTDLYNNGYAVSISVPYVLERLGADFTRFTALEAKRGGVLRVALAGPYAAT